MYNFTRLISVQFPPAARYRQPPKPITAFSTARPLLNPATAHLYHRSRNVAPNTCRLNTLLATQFLVGTFVLTKGHFSTAVVTTGIYGKCEHFGQPTAVTCNYERLEARNNQKQVQTDRWAVWGGFQ